MTHLDLFTVGWIAWLLFFAIEEGIALFISKRWQDTLSGHIWIWFGITQPKGRWFKIRRVVLLGLMAWLTVHFLTGGKFA